MRSNAPQPGHGNHPMAPIATALIPAAIVAQRTAEPAERLMGLQSGFSRLVAILANLRLPRARLSFRRLAAPRVR